MSNDIEQVLPPWLSKMRQAAQAAVTTEDIAAMVKAQVKKAKDGDQAALKFIFDNVLGGGSMKGATFVQNNYPDDPRKPTNAVPGSDDKLKKIQARINGGLPACDPSDRAKVDLS